MTNYKSTRIAIVVSRFNEPVTKRLLEGAENRLRELHIPENNVDIKWVPGAVEIPLIAQQFAMQNKFDAIICLGAVIRGETSHYDYVCQQVSDGCLQVGLKYNIPVIFGVLTTENGEQAFDRVGGAHGHKGREAVDGALEMINVMQSFNQVVREEIYAH
jgi:6,7-dimethyl-8-ribityllumazine synthase